MNKYPMSGTSVCVSLITLWSDARNMIYDAVAGVFRPTAAAAMVFGPGSAGGVVNIKIPRDERTADTE